MFTRIMVAAATAVLALSAASPAESHVVLLGEAHAAKIQSCDYIFTVQDYRSYASRVYKRPTVTKAAQRRMDAMHRCQHSYAARKAVGRFHVRYKRQREYREQLASLTPFPGPGGTRWAVPYYIVACESHGNWNAANPSGAIGPYQLLGHGAPWPVRTEADRLAHHRIARALYLSYGSSPWVCA